MHRDVVAEHRVDDLGQLVRVVDCRVQRELLKDKRVKNYIVQCSRCQLRVA